MALRIVQNGINHFSSNTHILFGNKKPRKLPLLLGHLPLLLGQDIVVQILGFYEYLLKNLLQHSLETNTFEELGSEFINFAFNCVIITLGLIVYLTGFSI